GDGVLLAYRGSSGKVTIPDGVKTIAQGCFSGHTGIVSVSMPPSLEVICEEAFADCRNLTSLTGGVNLKRIEDRAFSGCPLTTVKIGSNVEEVGLRAFDTTGTLQEGKPVTLDFQGGVLPGVGVVQTSQRLYNEAYRDLVFCGADVAIVPDENVVIDGTVLDPSQNGFRGVICCFNEDSAGVTILKYTGPGVNPLTISLPASIRYYGREYPVTQIREDVFSYLLPAADREDAGDRDADDGNVADREGSGEAVSDDGQALSEESSAGTTTSVANTVAGQHTNGHITVSLRSNTLTKPDCVQIDTNSITGSYEMIIADDVIAKQEMLDAYRALYGNADNLLLYGYDISMQDEYGVPITGLGKKNLLLTLPVPDDIEPEHARVLCVDEDGQLESVAAQLTEKNGQPCLQFYARHFSHYGIYTFLSDQGAQVSHGKLDASPDTGDGIHPKWFLCVGMVSAAMVLFLWRGKKSKI
ncbi:MAG: leucine-rich repeat domain-containing protein, partial [bacterium]|nr:leucine-rich repeat domain-containing protein [bacterium]